MSIQDAICLTLIVFIAVFVVGELVANNGRLWSRKKRKQQLDNTGRDDRQRQE